MNNMNNMNNMNKSATWKEDLERQGYVVIPGILSKKECEEYIRQLARTMEKVVARTEGGWEGFVEDKAPNGVIHGLDNLHTLWKIRSRPEIRRLFQELYGMDESLYLYIDRFNYRPPRLSLPYHSRWHIDEDPFEPQSDYQAFVSLTDIREKDACLGILTGSHHHVGDAMEAFGEDLHFFSRDHYDWFLSRGCTEQRVASPPGSLVIWNSGCIHKPLNSLRHTPRRRVVAYVRYFPTDRCAVEKRAEALRTYPEYKDLCLTPEQVLARYSPLVYPWCAEA